MTREPLLDTTVDSLAAGGEGVARDPSGRVTFIPGTTPGDRVKLRVLKATSTYARGEVVELVQGGASRVEPACPHAMRVGGRQPAPVCGGCQWQHVSRSEQLAAKQAIVTGALRKLEGLRVHPIEDPGPPLGWRRRARFHVERGVVGLYAPGKQEVVPIGSCPQLEPALDAAYRAVVAARPPDGELVLLVSYKGEVAVATEAPWPLAGELAGRAGIRVIGGAALEIEPGLCSGVWDFAQASASGNRALVARAAATLGKGPGRLLELHAGGGNLTRAYRANGWVVLASDVSEHAELVADAATALARYNGPFDAIALDPPRAGAPETIAGLLRHAPPVIVYVSCDVATLARDAGHLVAGGYRATDAYPLDLMPQTAHVEVVLRLARN
jgi:23S rRNA (uracil1939-C5)-methyltransferase